jgi:hypothetical protein
VKTSSARYKEAIESMGESSAAILSLRPVKFRYTKEIDAKATPQFGLVAEEVDKIAPDLVLHDASDKPFTVRYDEVNAMLLNEFLKEHKRVEELETTVAELKGEMEKVSARLEARESKARLVDNH